jgi:hypothetical protein
VKELVVDEFLVAIEYEISLLETQEDIGCFLSHPALFYYCAFFRLFE